MKRIQRQRTKGWRMPEGAVYVGRPTRWGNAFRVGWQDGYYLSRADAVELDRLATLRFLEDGEPEDVEKWVGPLRLATALACWCPVDEACHADTLIGWLAA